MLCEHVGSVANFYVTGGKDAKLRARNTFLGSKLVDAKKAETLGPPDHGSDV